MYSNSPPRQPKRHNYGVFDVENYHDYIWLWACVSTHEETTGTGIENALDYMIDSPINEWWVHNLKFDGSFLICELEKRGYIWTENNKPKGDYYTTLITGMGAWFTIKFEGVTLHCSYRKIPESVERLAKSYNLPIAKGEIDYHKPRFKGYVPTKKEIEYCLIDCRIVFAVLKIYFDSGRTGISAAGDAFKEYLKTLKYGKKTFERIFPQLPPAVDKYMRLAYKGGLVLVNHLHEGIQKNVHVYDINSSYPHKLRYCRLPCGKPRYFRFKPQGKRLWVATCIISFDVKKNGIPHLIEKNLIRGYSEPIECAKDYKMTCTSVDWEQFQIDYNVTDICWIDGFYFNDLSPDHYAKFLDPLIKIKAAESESGTKTAKGALAKMTMNSFSGKVGMRADSDLKHPIVKNGIIHYEKYEGNPRRTLYVPTIAFVTAYGRKQLLEALRATNGKWLYCDTDSVHRIGKYINEIEIHETKLGAWKLEKVWHYGVYLHAKCYIEQNIINGEVDSDFHIAGFKPIKAVKNSVGEWEITQDTVTVYDLYHGARFIKRSQKMISGGAEIIEKICEVK